MIQIHLTDAGDYWRNTYGVLMESTTLHTMSGAGVHNRSFNHIVQVWENRPSKARDANPEQLVTPYGEPTDARYTFITKAQASVISLAWEERKPQGDALLVDTDVELLVHGMSLGIFTIAAGRLRDPHLVLIKSPLTA